ncbi:hypothetical protein CPB83DRAFT_863891 [Crepidotus variabilis]|uniref:Uncharacterized protein n=1 Tax=Crepidotus variabilis TaxID=179855 RepID=A0A9P6E5D4_9AGAR|nr:hypothetical protein CPB83DRAFT_863891 [Crepidotus variabilis]
MGQLTDEAANAQKVLVKMGSRFLRSGRMEYLDGWTTLFELVGQRTMSDEYLIDIRRVLDTILDHLEECKIRACMGISGRTISLIQVKHGKPIYLKIVDFDWAGRAGEVYYPRGAQRQGWLAWTRWQW